MFLEGISQLSIMKWSTIYMTNNMNTGRLEIVPTVVEENIQQSIGVFDISAGSGNDDGHQGTLFFSEEKINDFWNLNNFKKNKRSILLFFLKFFRF